jgi:CHASE3 domain sensor protein
MMNAAAASGGSMDPVFRLRRAELSYNLTLPGEEQPAANDISEEYRGVSLMLGVALLLLWGVMSLARRYEQSLAWVNQSFNEGFKLTGQLGVILEALNHLGVDQHAFLSTGDKTFQDGVIESAETLEIEMSMLNSQTAGNSLRQSLVNDLSRSIEQVIASVGRSDAIRDAGGKKAAIAYFASQADPLSNAKSQANQLRIEIIRSIADRISKAHANSTLLGIIGSTMSAPLRPWARLLPAAAESAAAH